MRFEVCSERERKALEGRNMIVRGIFLQYSSRNDDGDDGEELGKEARPGPQKQEWSSLQFAKSLLYLLDWAKDGLCS